MGSKLFWLRASGLALLFGVLGIWLWIESTPPERVAPPPKEAIAIDRSPQVQAERKSQIDRWLAEGLFRRVEHDARGRSVRVVLRQPFYNLETPVQREYIDTIYRYYFDGSSVNDTVVLRDARHGNKIGDYNPYQGGLRLYK